MTMENNMGTDKISRLLLKTGIPLMLSLLINSLYNFVDSVFVSRIAEDALTALSLASPVQIFVSALGLGNAVGLNAAISKALGEKNREQVKKTANAAIFLAVCAWLLISVVCLLGVRWYFSWQSGGNEVIAAYGRDYLSICMLFSLGQMGQWVFDRFVIASGKSHLFLFTLSAASITNLILDPIFIFTFGLGTKGAANREITFSFILKPDWESVRAILRVGIPSTLVQVLTSFVSVIMNTILLAFSSTAVAVYGVCSRMMGLCTVGVHGINNGLIPIAAYNYGARKAGRIQDSVKWAMLYSGLFYLPILIILEMFPGMVLRLFNASEHMMAIGIPAVRIMAVAWLVFIPSLVFAAALQGLSIPKPSMLLTMLRQAILPVLLALLLSRTGWLPSVWLAFVISELVCIPLAMLFWKRNWSSLRISMECVS